jgi:hypothetical protein
VKAATLVLTLFMVGWAAGALHSPPAGQQAGIEADLTAGEAAARSECGTCHALPPPDILPRAAWRDEIARMFLIKAGQPEPTGPRGTAARIVSLPIEWQSIVKAYEARAPERLAPPASWPEPATPCRSKSGQSQDHLGLRTTRWRTFASSTWTEMASHRC